MINLIKNKNGQALVAAIVIVILLSLFAVVCSSLLGIAVGHSATGLVQSTQALYLAHAGLEWYIQQLADDTNWTDQTNPGIQSLGAGTFKVIVSNPAATSIDITSTGRVTGADGRQRERFVSATVKKCFPGTRFAVFWQQDPGSTLLFASGTHIVGDFWSVGSTTINSGSDVTNGVVYYGSGETISGNGVYTTQEVTPPFPDMPVFDPDIYYNPLKADWNSRINDADEDNHGQTGGKSLIIDGITVNWSGQNKTAKDIEVINGGVITGSDFTVSCKSFKLQNGSQIDSNASDFTISCRVDFEMTQDSQINAHDYRINSSRHFEMSNTASINSDGFELYLDDDFNTNGDVSLTGAGYIVCASETGNVLLHNEPGDSGTLTVTPSGGDIYFLSGDTMTVNSTRNDTTVNLDNGCFLYSRNPKGRDEFLIIRNAKTTISGSTLVAERGILVQSGADITNDSFLYVDYASSNTDNLLWITGSGTTVDGTVVSRGRSSPSLRIDSGASITGLVYQYGDSTLGRTQIDDGSGSAPTITGALLVRQFHNDLFGPATVTGDLTALPSPLPTGFDDFEVYVDTNTWDGL
ncbi:hypothetical protein ACFL96_17890 [Thermoproteota archaeon]